MTSVVLSPDPTLFGSEYLLKDDFLSTVAAGAVNGTPATPGPGTRVVNDTTNKLSVLAGNMVVSGGAAAYGNPGIWYGAITRVAGRLMVAKISWSNMGTVSIVGFDSNTTGAIAENGLDVWGGGVLKNRESTSSPILETIGALTTPILVCVVLRASGAYLFYKTATGNWTLCWVSSIGSTSTVYPSIVNFDSIFSMDYIRVPTKLWLPTPIASDSFNRGNGALGSTDGAGHAEANGGSGLAWTGSTWTISTNTAIDTPTLSTVIMDGATLNGNMETGDPPTGWVASTATLNGVADERTGGSGTQSLDVADIGSAFGEARQAVTVEASEWYLLSVWINGGSTTGKIRTLTTAWLVTSTPSAGSWANVFASGRAPSTSDTIRCQNQGALDGKNCRYDDISLKKLTLSTLFASLSAGTADVVSEVAITMSSTGTCAGLVLNLDSSDSPANFILVYYTLAGIMVDECVAGVYASKMALTAAAYVAGAVLRVVRDGTSLLVFYNGVKIGSTTTMAANTNILHGLFSTHSGNTFDSFVVWARGTGGEYTRLNEFIG